MASRNFEEWLATFTDTVATWEYYTDFKKVYDHVDNIKIELNILNSLIGSKNVEEDFRNILIKYPETLKCIPILLAKRENEIAIKDSKKDYYFKFNIMNYSIDEYVLFMRKTGLFDLLENHIINNLIDYVSGVEVGLDTNARKNRTGHAMEDLVESFIIDAGFIKKESYFKEMYKSEIENKWDIDLSKISNDGKMEKRFDFVIKTDNQVYGIEVNFYSGGGSKLNETARSYKTITLEAAEIAGFTFIWITDGKGWNSAKRNLQETFDVLEHIYNINDLKNDLFKQIL
jgi:type II restriction enzyme